MKSIDDVFRFMSQCSNLNTEFKSRIGTLVAEVYADGWKNGHKAGRENATNAPVTSNVTTGIQDEAMSVICLEYDSVLKLLIPYLDEKQCIASTNAFADSVRPAVAKAISLAWAGGFRSGAEHERAACLDAIEAAASNIVDRHTVEHGGVRTPIPTILPIECYRDAFNYKLSDRESLKHRENWVQWPNIMRHEYVQARLVDGKPCVQIVVNGEYKGTVRPDGAIVREREPTEQFVDLALKVAHADAHEKLSPEGVGTLRVPDSRIGLFLFIDSKGNEFELKNTEYGTVIVRGEVVLGKVYRCDANASCSTGSNGTFFVKHTECAFRMCEDYGALTRAVFSFCNWACDPGAAPKFMRNRVGVEGHEGFTVRHDVSRFDVLDFYGNKGVSLTPNSKGGFDELPIIAPHNDRERAIVDAAKRTIRSKFYGNMV